MLIDWVSCYWERGTEPRWAARDWDSRGDRIMRYCPRSGTVRWESSCWDSVRSDSHQLAVQITGSVVRIQGSPARLFGDGCNTFGVGPASGDLLACVWAMIRHAADGAGVWLPLPATAWKVTRVDVTRNFLLPSAADVRAALGFLRGTEGGRYRVTAVSGETAYWGGKSKLRRGKAYGKGPQLRYWMRNFERKKLECPRTYTEAELALADRLLRVELTLASQWWRERAPCKWNEITAEQLAEQWESYFGRMLGPAREATMLSNDMDLLPKFEAVAQTPGRGRAAFRTWQIVKATGWEHARASMPRATWYRHLTIMRSAGLGDMDISAGQVVPMRRRAVDMVPVSSWEELRTGEAA